MLEIISALLISGIAIMVFMPLFSKPKSKRRRVSIAIGMITPVASAALYLAMGSSTAVIAEPNPISVKALEPIIAPTLGSVEQMAESLHKRLLKTPDDKNGWLLLAKSYEHMGNTKAAIAARKRAEKSVTSDTTPQGKVSLHGTITLSSELAASLDDTDTIFVYAREANGPRIPIAARRYPATDLPINFVLDETYILSTTRPLASAASVFIGAKLSRSGNAITTGPKLAGLSEEISPFSNDAVQILIQRTPADD